MDIIYHFMQDMWKNNMIEQYFNYKDSTAKKMADFFEAGVQNKEPKEDKKKSSSD